MENLGYLFAVYVIIWTAVFGYVFFLYHKQKKLKREIESLKDRLNKQE